MPGKSSSRTVRADSRSAPAEAPPASGEVFVTRQVHFSAAHRLSNRRLGARWNDEEFGDCAHHHGHNYVLEATVAGRPDPKTGYVVNLADLKRLLWRAVAGPCDHRDLNADVEFLRGVIPTTENLVVAFWRRIAPRVRGGRLHRLRLYETPRNYADYYGP